MSADGPGEEGEYGVPDRRGTTMPTTKGTKLALVASAIGLGFPVRAVYRLTRLRSPAMFIPMRLMLIPVCLAAVLSGCGGGGGGLTEAERGEWTDYCLPVAERRAAEGEVAAETCASLAADIADRVERGWEKQCAIQYHRHLLADVDGPIPCD